MPRARANGRDLFYRLDGAGPPLLLIAGLGTDHRAWASVAPALAADFRCISFDNRDCGRSDVSGRAYTIADMAADAAGLLDALGIERAHVAGWSMGGAIAQELAIAFPRRVQRLVLIATYTSGDPRGTAIFQGWSLLRRRLSREEYLRVTYPFVFTHRDYRREGFVEGMIRAALADPHSQAPEAYERQVAATTTFNSEDRLGGIQAPTLIINGDDDVLTPLRFARKLEQGIPDARLVLAPGAGHGILWSDPEFVTREMAAFLLGG